MSGLSSMEHPYCQPPAPQGTRTDRGPREFLVPEALTLLILVGLPWLTLGMLLLFNPRYELHLFDPAMPGISLLLAALVAQLVGAVAAYSAQALVRSLGKHAGPARTQEGHHPSPDWRRLFGTLHSPGHGTGCPRPRCNCVGRGDHAIDRLRCATGQPNKSLKPWRNARTFG